MGRKRKRGRKEEGRTLPLQHHALELVVEDEDLDTDVVLRRRSKLHRSHTERRITVNINDNLLGVGDFRANSSGETEAHSLRVVSSVPRNQTDQREE
jgi:hypothetical protein